jgi:hypothetical protein
MLSPFLLVPRFEWGPEIAALGCPVGDRLRLVLMGGRLAERKCEVVNTEGE